jgi:hypothetical protein
MEYCTCSKWTRKPYLRLSAKHLRRWIRLPRRAGACSWRTVDGPHSVPSIEYSHTVDFLCLILAFGQSSVQCGVTRYNHLSDQDWRVRAEGCLLALAAGDRSLWAAIACICRTGNRRHSRSWCRDTRIRTWRGSAIERHRMNDGVSFSRANREVPKHTGMRCRLPHSAALARAHHAATSAQSDLGSLIESFIELRSQVFMLPIFHRRTSC